MPLQTLRFGLKVAVAEPTRIRIQVRAHLVRANERQFVDLKTQGGLCIPMGKIIRARDKTIYFY